ncbi:MAG: hypothetical protein G8345_16165 [Magnetococcales bacterium]|nr:hypothetical protein [Magnetococcales bacterium]NGZ28410.1 hypothetical protein [Magnetococcales bacterium]
MDNRGSSLEVMAPADEAARVKTIVMENIREGCYSFLTKDMPNHGTPCQDNMEAFRRTLPATKDLLVRAFREARAIEEKEAMAG